MSLPRSSPHIPKHLREDSGFGKGQGHVAHEDSDHLCISTAWLSPTRTALFIRPLSFLPVPQHPLSTALSRGFLGKQGPLKPSMSHSAAASSQHHFIHRSFRKVGRLITPSASPHVAEPHMAGPEMFSSHGLSMCECAVCPGWLSLSILQH